MSRSPKGKKIQHTNEIERWIVNMSDRAYKYLKDKYEENINPTNFKVRVVLDMTDTLVDREEHWKEDTITQKQVLDYLIPLMYEVDMDKKYLEISELLYEKYVEKDPHKFTTIKLFRFTGLKPMDLIVDVVYDLVEINVDITGVLERSGIEVVGEILPYWKISSSEESDVAKRLVEYVSKGS